MVIDPSDLCPKTPAGHAPAGDPPIGVVDLLQVGSCNADDLPEDLEGLQRLRGEWERLSTLMREIKRLIDSEIRRHLGPGGAMAWGDRRFVSRSRHEWKWTDPDGILEWLGADAFRAVPGSAVRKTAVEQIARLRARARSADEETAVELVLARYGRYEDKGGLDVKPVEMAPKWTQRLEHGQAVIRAPRDFPEPTE
jgi:hypothetical protein